MTPQSVSSLDPHPPGCKPMKPTVLSTQMSHRYLEFNVLETKIFILFAFQPAAPSKCLQILTIS